MVLVYGASGGPIEEGQRISDEHLIRRTFSFHRSTRHSCVIFYSTVCSGTKFNYELLSFPRTQAVTIFIPLCILLYLPEVDISRVVMGITNSAIPYLTGFMC